MRSHRLLPDHILRRDQAAAGDQDRGDGDVGARFCKARADQERGREQRRRVGGGAEHADIAALHADVPGVKRGTDRSDAERDDREPLRRRLRPDRGLDQPCTIAASSAVARQKPATASVGTDFNRRDITE